jgi:hypothetical protein
MRRGNSHFPISSKSNVQESGEYGYRGFDFGKSIAENIALIIAAGQAIVILLLKGFGLLIGGCFSGGGKIQEIWMMVHQR